MASRRSHSKVTKLPPALLDAINEAIVKRGATYDELTELVGGWVSKGKIAAEDAPSRAGLARYGRNFLARMEQLTVAREAAKQIVASSGGDGLVMDEAATNLVLNEIMSIFMSRDPEQGLKPGDVAKIAAGLGKLQQSSVMREKIKGEFERRAKDAEKAVNEIQRAGGLTKEHANVIRAKILGIHVDEPGRKSASTAAG